MTQKGISLLTYQSTSDPSLISPKPDKEASGELLNLNDSVHDDENVDVPNPGFLIPLATKTGLVKSALQI